MKPTLLITIAAFALPTSLAAQAFEDIAALDEQIAASLGAGADSMPTPIDSRLKLARCPQIPVIDPPALGAVAIRCLPLGWRIRVNLKQTKQRAAQDNAHITVRRGDAVELIISGESYDVSANAIAMDDGTIGKAIRVKTLTSKNPVLAIVKGTGSVQIFD